MTDSTLDGRVALVTGAASGIGAATAIALAEAGAAVAVLDRDAAGAERTASRIRSAGGNATVYQIDLAATNQIAETVAAIAADLGRIDYLINGAAIGGGSDSVLEVDEEAWDRIFTINLKAPLMLTQAVARHMIERGEGGRIVNISSSSAFRARRSPAAYASSKAALVQLTRCAAAQLSQHDINVNAVAPGLTATGMTEAMGEEGLQRGVEEGPLANLFRRVSQPEDVAAAVVFLCLPASRQVTAQVIHTSAGAVV